MIINVGSRQSMPLNAHKRIEQSLYSTRQYLLQNANKCIETLDNPLSVNICKQLKKANTEEQQIKR